MEISFLDYRLKPKVMEIIKNEKFFECDDIKDLNLLNMYMITSDYNFIGFFGLEQRDGNLNVVYLYIFSEYRNKHYGTRVLNEIVKRYSSNYSYIYLSVHKENKPAINLYRHYSFLGKDCQTLFKNDDFNKIKDNLFLNDNSYEVILHLDNNYDRRLARYKAFLSFLPFDVSND